MTDEVLGGAVEFVITDNFNFWMVFEGILFQPGTHRSVLSGFIGDLPGLRIYRRVGVSLKF